MDCESTGLSNSNVTAALVGTPVARSAGLSEILFGLETSMPERVANVDGEGMMMLPARS